MANLPCEEGVMRGGPAAPEKTRVGVWVLAATILGSSMAFIDGTVVNVALPALQSALNATVTDVQWVIEAYSLLLSALLLVGGSLGDRYGRRHVFVIGVIIFGAASAWCGLASGIRSLIMAPAVPGFCAPVVLPRRLPLIMPSLFAGDCGHAVWNPAGSFAITV